MPRTVAQLERKVIELERLVNSLLRPKSIAKIIAGTGASDAKLVTVPSGGIAAKSGSTVSSGTATEQKITGSTVGTNTSTLTLFNPWPFALPQNMLIVALKERVSSKWIALHPGVVDVQWNNPDLEQTYDGAAMLNVDTAEVCS